jgi:hypothetical protein
VSENVRQRYSIATGGGEARAGSNQGSKPAYAKGGAVRSVYGNGGGVTHKSSPSGFKKMPGGKC